MRIFYISPSTIPSRSANSIHVMRMADALGKLGHQVTLFFNRSIRSRTGLRQTIERYYGVDVGGVELASVYLPSFRGRIAGIAAVAVWRYLRALAVRNPPDVIIARNLYAAYVHCRLGRTRMVFEAHQLEDGFRKSLQRYVTSAPSVTTVAISQSLAGRLSAEFSLRGRRIHVLPDAAPAGICPLSPEERKAGRARLLRDVGVDAPRWLAGYFGQLYPGRGVELLVSLATRHPEVVFVVYGGDERQVEALKRKASAKNMRFMGYIPPAQAIETAALMDVLLMPYQHSVAIEAAGRTNTVEWMSPMKMFEYMAVGVPVIASRLPVLTEVLRDGDNCLMADAADVEAWSRCLTRLTREEGLAPALGERAHRDYLRGYDWQTRSARLLAAASENGAP